MASILFPEVDVEVVKITLTKKDNSGTTTLYFGLDYWASGRLYTTNPEVLPLLASSPTVRRGVGIYAGIKYDVSVDLYAKTSMTEAGKSFSDLLDAYEIQNADVQVLYYSKPLGDVTTHSDSVNIRQTLKVIEVRYSDDGATASLRCRDVFFKDKEISRKLSSELFPTMELKYDGEYGPIVFGQSTVSADGIVIDAPIIDASLQLTPSQRQTLKVFSGWTFPGHPNKEFKRLLVRNQHKQIDPSEWLQTDLVADPQTPTDGDSSLGGSTPTSLASYWRGVVHSPATNAQILTMIQVYGFITGTVATADGIYRMQIYHAEYQADGDTYAPIGSPLRTITHDTEAADVVVGSSSVQFNLKEPLVMSPDVNYMFTIEWTNLDDATNYINAGIAAIGGEVHYYRDNAETERGWNKGVDVALALEWYSLGDGDDAFKDGTTSGDKRHSYYHLESVYSDTTLNHGLEFKIGISGLKDDGSGTYTGSAGALIENPADIIRFALMNSDFGLGLSSTYVNTSTLDSVRSSLSSLGLKLKIVIDKETTAEDLINEICRQSRIVYYKTKDGKVALYYPVPINNTFTARLSQAVLGGEMQIEGVRDADYSTVVNEFRQQYKRDELNQPTDAAVIRRSEREKLAGIIEINPTTSSANDDYREGLCSVSQAKYGKREMTFPLSFYDAATDAQKIQNYYCDRFSTLQKRAILRLPRRTYFNTLDLFSTIQAHHVGISAYDGTALPGKQHYQGTPIVTYSENIPSVVWAGGVFEGQVYEVEEEGPWFIITAETISVF